jgi:hypothetical protein
MVLSNVGTIMHKYGQNYKATWRESEKYMSNM